MLTNNNNTPSSAPLPPPPLPPADWGKNWKPAKNNDKNENTLGSTPSKTSNSTQLKRGLSEVSNPNLFEELKNNSKFKEANNANGETADKGSNIRQSEPNRGLTPKPVSPRVLSPQQDNGNSNKPSGTNNSTQSEKGLSENPIQLPTEQKIDTPILINTLVGISKTAALKYSIAILLLFTSGAVAGVCTYFMISAVSSGVAVPVLFAVIASVSALVMLSSAVYLINPHISAINSEKGVDPGRKQSQYSELQKETESLEHSNTTISSPKMSGTPSTPPPPPLPPVKSNDLSTAPRVTRKSSPSDANQKNVQQKQSNTSVDARSDLLAAIRQPRTLKKVPDEQKNYLPKDDLKIPQKQEEESTPGKQENGVQPLNQNQSQNSDSQAAKKLEHSKSEDMQQMNSLAIAIQKQRVKSDVQDEQLDSLDGQYDSFFSLEEEQCKAVKKEQENCTRKPDAALLILSNIPLSKFSPLESPINNLSSNIVFPKVNDKDIIRYLSYNGI